MAELIIYTLPAVGGTSSLSLSQHFAVTMSANFYFKQARFLNCGFTSFSTHMWCSPWLPITVSSQSHFVFLTVKKIRVVPQRPKLRATSSFRNLYMQAGSEYVRQISKILKSQVTMLTSTSSTSLPEGNVIVLISQSLLPVIVYFHHY